MRWLLLTVLVGCASFDEPEFPDPTIEVLQSDEFETLVRGPNYTMHFPGGMDRVHLPDSFTVNGREMLASSTTCLSESQLGIAVFPAVLGSASPHGGVPTPSSDNNLPNFLSIDLDGPHIARIEVGFSVDYTCNGSQTLSGRTIYTFFPTGRIVRQDLDIRPSTNNLASTAGCSCEVSSDPNEFFFTSYWAFTPSEANVDAQDQPVSVNAQGACSNYDDRVLAVQFDGETSRIGVNGIASHVFDFVAQAPALTTSPHNVTSAVQIEGSRALGCGEILARIGHQEAVFADEAGPRTYVPNPDGIYADDFGTRTDPFTITPGAAALPPGFTIAIDLDGGTADIRLEDGTQPNMLIQRDFEGSTRFFVVFVDGLPAGRSITVEPK